jgi:Zn-dependent protease
MGSPDFGNVLLQIVALLFSVVFHEVSHGWVAEKYGDPTARYMGRITLNPVPHLDLWGSILMPAILAFTHSPILFGYAKPVPVDVRNLRNPRLDGLKVALAGPLSNLLLGTACAILFGVSAAYLGVEHALSRLLASGIVINSVLAVFNLLPIPPLDGSWVLEHTLRGQAYNVFRAIRPYGMLLLLAILFLPFLSDVLIGIPVSYVRGLFLDLSQLIYGWIR